MVAKCNRNSRIVLRRKVKNGMIKTGVREWTPKELADLPGYQYTYEEGAEYLDEEMQRVNRYYASTDGGDMIKIMPPIKKKLSKKLLNDFKKLGAEFTDEELREIEISLDEIDHFDIDALKEQGYDAAQIKAFELCQPKDREIGMTKDSPVTVHNKIKKLKNINYDYYVAEANKIIDYKLKLEE